MELVTFQSAGNARSTEPHQPGLIIILTVNNYSNNSNCQLFHSHNVSDFKHSTWINSLTLQQPEEVGTITVTIYDEESELSEIQKCLTICLRSQCQGWCNLTHSVFSKPLTHSLQRSWFCPGQHDQLGVFLQSERSPVWFLVRAHAWVVGQVPGWGACERRLIDVSLSHQCFSPSLSPSLPLSQEDKIFFKN